MSSVTTPGTTNEEGQSVGEFPLAEAFHIARQLEHAGITAQLTGRGTYRVTVDSSQFTRARALV